MGKLNIAHHKSYHPYRLDNIEKVRRDEEEARLKEAKEEGRIMLADSEARIQLLRDRAGLGGGSSKKKRREEEKEEMKLLKEAATGQTVVQAGGGGLSSLTSAASGGHINFFEGLEQDAMTAALQRSREIEKAAKGKVKSNGPTEETEKGIALAPSAKDLNPWYSAKEIDPEKDRNDDKKKKDLFTKTLTDPLTSINQELHTRFPNPPPPPSSRRYDVNAYDPQQPRYSQRPLSSSQHQSQSSKTTDPLLQARLDRESSERQRALDLIAKKKREQEREGMISVSATPTTVHRGRGMYEYGDQFNRKEVEEAKGYGMRDRGWSGRGGRDDRETGARRNRSWDRGWDERGDRDRDTREMGRRRW